MPNSSKRNRPPRPPKTLSSSRTSADAQPDARQPGSNAAVQNEQNVTKAKEWVDRHKT
ncbi:MAG: DUF3787 domain-containing protein [Oscillospiraceae bacterium]|nr:DUF3787 domain-containing protein [Oscillospiraceae bacterium]